MKHPAKFSDAILAAIEPLLPEWGVILDPFAGTGRIHQLETALRWTYGIEIEPEWAALHPNTRVGNALNLPAGWTGLFDAIVTSPTYGNRMADHHEAKDSSRRMTYRHTLGRPLHENNSGQLQWGPKYREFHEAAWAEAVRVLRPGGLFVLNCSDHIRAGEMQHVTRWHWKTLRGLGLETAAAKTVPTPRMRYGANGSSRVPFEWVIALRKPT